MTSEQPTPTAIAELIERLELAGLDDDGSFNSVAPEDCHEAAQALRTLAAENERMREALEPFASPPLYVFDEDRLYVPTPQPDDWIGGGQFSTNDFRRARQALEKRHAGK